MALTVVTQLVPVAKLALLVHCMACSWGHGRMAFLPELELLLLITGVGEAGGQIRGREGAEEGRERTGDGWIYGKKGRVKMELLIMIINSG